MPKLRFSGGRCVMSRVVDEDVARRGLDEARDDHQERGLARAGRAEQRQELAARHVERHAVDGGDAAVVLGDVAQRQVVHSQLVM